MRKCAGHLRSSPDPIQSEDKAVSLASTARNRLKGMRRRAAKLLARIEADSFDYTAGASLQTSSQEATSQSLDSMLHSLQHSAENGDVAGE